MRAAAAALAALALLAVPASVGAKSFHTPSGNIACLYSAKGGPGPFLRCDVHSLNDTAFRLDRKHRGRRVHVTDAVPAGHVLAYGRSLRLGPFTCKSRRTGLTCRARKGVGPGFRVSRQGYTIFP